MIGSGCGSHLQNENIEQIHGEGFVDKLVPTMRTAREAPRFDLWDTSWSLVITLLLRPDKNTR
jgi:hypothetical protein